MTTKSTTGMSNLRTMNRATLASKAKDVVRTLRPGAIREMWNDPMGRRILSIPIALLAFFVLRWVYLEFTTETTDDAFVQAHVHVVGPRISGTVVEVAVKDNQIVKKGEVLVKLDPRDFEVQAKIAEARETKARLALQRWAEREEYLHPNELLQKNMDAADALAAQAALKQANLNVEYTAIIAPEDGQIGNRAVETGQQVQPGQALMALVEQTPWVVANFKEGQAAKLKPGMRAEISVDAIPEREFKGHVDSIAPGSGATFSLLPPDNATGNFTKIVQRIPVKIVFEPESIKGYESRLAAGMSTYITVHR